MKKKTTILYAAMACSAMLIITGCSSKPSDAERAALKNEIKEEMKAEEELAKTKRELNAAKTELANQKIQAQAAAARQKAAAQAAPSVHTANGNAYNIRDLSGMTNIRQSPGGAVCMKLKAHTQYDIYGDYSQNGWLHLTAVYNCNEGYWVKFHSSGTGSYWIALETLY